MSKAEQLQGGSYTINTDTHTRELVEQTKPSGVNTEEQTKGEVVKLEVVKPNIDKKDK